MSKLAERTQKIANTFIGNFIVFINSPWGEVFKCLEHTTSGFRLRAVSFPGDEERILRTRKMRLATEEEIANAVAARIQGHPF